MVGIRGGETVGRAYVEILADGDGLPASIRKEFDEAAGEINEVGEEHGDEYAEGARKAMRRNRPATHAEQEEMFKVAAHRMRALADETLTPYFKRTEQRLRKFGGGSLGERMVENFRRDFLKAGGYDAIFSTDESGDAILKDLTPMMEKALKEMQAEERKVNAQRDAEFRSLTGKMVQSESRMNTALAGLGRDRAARERRENKEALRDWDLTFKEMERAVTDREAAIRKAEIDRINRLEQLTVSVKKLTSAHKVDRDERERLLALTKDLNKEFTKTTRIGGGDTDSINKTLLNMERRLRVLSPGLVGFNNRLDRTAETTGRLFGRGSRSELLNFFGSVTEGISRLAFSIPKLGEKFLTFGRLVKSGEGVVASLRTAFTGAASGGSSLAASLTAAAVAIPVVVVVVGTLVAAVSLLLGTLTALASTISFALVGGLAALAGSIAPIVAGFGVLAIAIRSMSDEQKKMAKEAFKPLIAGFKEIGEAAANSIFGGKGSKEMEDTASRFKQTISNMANALTSSNMKTLVTEIGTEIGKIGNRWSDAIDSPGFRHFLDVMSETLPKQMQSLGQIVQNVVAAMGNTLIAMQPLVETFLNWLEKITGQWAKWTGTDEGQRKMIAFFERAVDSAKSLGHFLKELGGLFADLLFNATGNDAGNSLFDSMADSIAKFRKYIDDGKLEQWFTDSKKFAEDLGGALKTLGNILDKLDSPEFRAFATLMVYSLEQTLDAVSNLIDPVLDLAAALKDLFSGDFEGFAQNMGKMLLDSFTFGHADEVIQLWKDTGSDIVQGLWDGIVEKFTEFISWVGSLPQKLIDAFRIPLGIASPSTVFMQIGRDIILGLLGGLAEMAGQAITFLGSLALQMAGALLSGLGQGFQQVGALSAQFAGNLRTWIGGALDWVGQKAQQIGSFFSGALSNAFRTAQGAASTLGGFLRGALSTALEAARSAGSRIASFFSGALSTAFRGAKSAADGVKNAISGIGSVIGGVISKVRDLISWLGRIKVPKLNPGGGVPFVPGIKRGGLVDAFSGLYQRQKMGRGGFANFAQNYQIGESGREAIVPLNRPLGQVDPAVRALSAFAQGKWGGNTTNNQRTIDASGWTIISPNDSETVAKEMLDALTQKIM